MKKYLSIAALTTVLLTSVAGHAAETIQCNVNVNCDDVKAVYAATKRAWLQLRKTNNANAKRYEEVCYRDVQQIQGWLNTPHSWSAQTARMYFQNCNLGLQEM